MSLTRRSVVAIALTTFALMHACGGDEGGGVAGNTGGSLNTGGSSASGGGGTGADGGLVFDGPQGEVESISVEPATTTIDVVNGTSTPAQFKAVGKLKTGGTTTVPATWAFDRLDLGVISAGGSLKAHGSKGGTGTVTATFGALTATATATIALKLEDDSAGLTAADKAKFATPDSNPSGTLLYPYDKTVFARGILAPELMWSGGAAGDKYKLEIVDKAVTLTAFFAADPPSRFVMKKDWWTALTESSDGAAVSVKLSRLDAGGTAHQAMAQTWKIAPGSLRGTIYYWAVNLGQIVKINPGASAPVPAFDPGLASQLGSPAPIAGHQGENPAWDSAGGGKRCVACHTVSKDGSTLAASFSACEKAKTGCARPWGIVDTATEKIKLVSTYQPAPFIYSALNPDGKRLVADTVSFKMNMFDTATGAPIASALDGYSQVAVPQFSPDGKLMAFASNATGGYPVEFSKSDLDVVDVDLNTAPFFTNRKNIQQAAASNEEISFPSFSPDSQWVFYQRGNYSRASYQTVAGGPLLTGYNDLFMADVAKAVGQIKLAQANGEGTLPPKEAKRNYQPRANPIAVGGYAWVVFVSPRDYGNRMQSTTDATSQNRKQLWVAAIDLNPTPGTDPSHPAFWLPGQDQQTINMDAYWAMEPCKQNGIECNEGYECCTGFCRDQGDGTFKCVPPPTNTCALVGEKCTTAADCCPKPGSKIQCIGGVCALPGPA